MRLIGAAVSHRRPLNLWFNVLILLDDIKARTAGLPPVEVSMTHDESLGIVAVQFGEQPPQRIFLLHCARVLGSTAVTCQSAHIAHSDAVAVVPLAVRPCHVLLTSALDGAVGGDDVVVAAAVPSEGTMIAVDVPHSELTALAVGGAVNDNKCNISHTDSELGDSPTGCAGQDQFHDSQYVERDALPVCFHTRCF